METLFVIVIVILCFLYVVNKQKRDENREAQIREQKAREEQRKKENLEKASPYASLDRLNGVLTVTKCCPEVGNALSIQKHTNYRGIQHPSTYTINMASAGGITMGGITEHKGQYEERFSETDKAKLIFDNFVVEMIQLNTADSDRARKHGLQVDFNGRIRVTNVLDDDDYEAYKRELMVASSLTSKGIYTNQYEALRFRSFAEIKRILEFVATKAPSV